MCPRRSVISQTRRAAHVPRRCRADTSGSALVTQVTDRCCRAAPSNDRQESRSPCASHQPHCPSADALGPRSRHTDRLPPRSRAGACSATASCSSRTPASCCPTAASSARTGRRTCRLLQPPPDSTPLAALSPAYVLDRRAGADQVAVAVARRRCGRPAASTCPPRSTPAGKAASLAGVRVRPSRRRARPRCAGRCAAGCRRPATRPTPTRSISPRIAIIASQNRSSSARSSRLGRLDHQRAGHRERHRRRVEAVVDQPLGDVVDGDAGRLGDRPQVEDALVRDQAAAAGVEHRVVRRAAGAAT